MEKKLLFLSLLAFLFTDCKKDIIEPPYFDEFCFHYEAMVSPFPHKDMQIKSDRSFQIILSSLEDTLFNFQAMHDTIDGVITGEEMDKLIGYCKLADVYTVEFTNTLDDSLICEVITDFIYSITIKGNNNQSNILSYTYCYIPRESYYLLDYAASLLSLYSD
jgi:hypothetical protein